MGLLIFKHGTKPYRIGFREIIVETKEGVQPSIKFDGKIL